MKVDVLNNTLKFEGVLDECCSIDDLLSAFSELKTGGDFKPPIEVNLSDVKRANSSGIIVWLKFLKQVGCSVCYVDAPVWLVDQFCMINQFFENGSTVRSLQAPFYCDETGESTTVPFDIGSGIPLLSSYQSFEIENRDINGLDYEPDFDPGQFFSFLPGILKNYEKSS